MGVTKSGVAVIGKLKAAAKQTAAKTAANIPSGPLMNALGAQLSAQVSQIESGIKGTVDNFQGRIKSLQSNLLKVIQANKDLELQNQQLSKQVVDLERENSHLSLTLESTEIELNTLRTKLGNITKLLEGIPDIKPARKASAKRK